MGVPLRTGKRTMLVLVQEIVRRQAFGVDVDVRTLAAGVLVHELEAPRCARRDGETHPAEARNDSEAATHGPGANPGVPRPATAGAGWQRRRAASPCAGTSA
jgi:hypothetical protein